MFKIYGDTDGVFWQWDLNQKLVVEDDTCSEVQLSRSGSESSITAEIYDLNGIRLVDIPDEFFIEYGTLIAYAVSKNSNGSCTKKADYFFIMERAKPEGYVYRLREVLDYKYLAKLIGELSKLNTENKVDLVSSINEVLSNNSNIDTTALAVAIREYFEENPPLLPEITEDDEGKILAVVGGKWKPAGLPTYEGECEIVPSVNPQSIPTANRFIREDVVVNSIPYSEVTNSANGTTFIIG